MKAIHYLFLTFFISLGILFTTVDANTEEMPTKFFSLVGKWERVTQVGNFLVVKSVLNSEELIEANPDYSASRKNNMKEMIAEETVIFLTLKNIGISDIVFSIDDMILENDQKRKIGRASCRKRV